MTTAEKVIKTKVGVLELGKQLGDVSKACRAVGGGLVSLAIFFTKGFGSQPGTARGQVYYCIILKPNVASLHGPTVAH